MDGPVNMCFEESVAKQRAMELCEMLDVCGIINCISHENDLL